MADRHARNLLASALRQLLARQITNDNFEDAFPQSEDGIVEPIESRVWTFYSDMYPHKLSRKLTKVVRSDVARWILFLQSDLEYRWPRGPLDDFPIYNSYLNILTFGWWERRKELQMKAWEQHGDVTVWPFFEKEEFYKARKRPCFLAGSSLSSFNRGHHKAGEVTFGTGSG